MSTLKEGINDNDDYDDILAIQGPIDVNALSSSEMIKISSTLKSKAKKKMIKVQRKEAQVILLERDALLDLMLEVDCDEYATPISQLDRLMTATGEKMKSLKDEEM